jgi:hypothetical protein
MTDQMFTVTLPSNSNMQSHPTNRGSKYIVKLAAPLNFTGQTLNEEVNWEVALTSMYYTNRFYNIRDTAVIYVVVSFPSIAAITTSGLIPRDSPTVQYTPTFDLNTISALPLVERTLLATYIKPPESPGTSFIVTGKIVIRPGFYKDPAAVYNIIVDEFNKMYGNPRYNTRLEAIIKGSDGTLSFKFTPSTNIVHMYTQEAFLMNTLGFVGSDKDNGEPLYDMNFTGRKTPRFDMVQSMYVYCDVVKPQHVGDTLAPLLNIVPVQGSPSQRVNYPMTQLEYLPVNRTFIDCISVEICDEYGKHVKFPDDVENVVCRLRFRRSKHSALML